jgi:hypothetical protein
MNSQPARASVRPGGFPLLRHGPRLALTALEDLVAHPHVEQVIGRLATDERFRAAFHANAAAVFEDLADEGLTLTPTEREALTRTSPLAWDALASALDPRLLKVALPVEDLPS